MYLCISFKLYNNLLRFRRDRQGDWGWEKRNVLCAQGHTTRKRLETEPSQILLLGCHAVFQEHTQNCLGLSVPWRLQALGTNGTSEQGWTSRAVDQCELAAWPNKDARAILGGRREEGGGGGESVIGTPNFSSPLSLPQAYFPWLIPV